jgi:plastocyanin
MRALLLIAAFATLALAGGAAAENPTLLATVGPGFSIRLTDASGARAVQVVPGTYTINVSDLSSEHNFHITGPGVDQTTTVDGTGTATWTVTFQEGTYHYECDAHPTTMKGDLIVSATAPPPAPTTTTTLPPAPPPVRPVLLRAKVGPGATISLTRAGVRVRALAAGPAVIAVMDLSAKDNFHLIGPGVNRQTSKAARAKVSWRVRLRAGIYRYRSDASAALKGSFTVRA